LFSKVKSHELSHQGRPNHDASFTSKAYITSACVGGHDANPTNTISPSLEFALSSLVVASDEQYESIPDDEIGLLAGKFCAMHKFWKERRRNSRNSQGCFKCYDTTYFITDFPKRKKYDFSNKNDYNNKNNYNNRNEYNNKKDYNNMNDYNNKNDYKKMNRFGDKKKKNIKKIMS
jgi:hypothetical protein